MEEDMYSEVSSKTKEVMLEIITKEVIKALNFVCTIKIPREELDGAHICVDNLMKDIKFCYVGLVQNYHRAYMIAKGEIGDINLRNIFNDLIYKALLDRGITSHLAKLCSSAEVMLDLMGIVENYAAIYEIIREQLLTIVLAQKGTDNSHSCLRSNFGIIDIHV